MLYFYFLGAPRIERDGILVETDTRKALALAAYLTLTQTAHQRDELATLFYPDADAAHARAALRRTLSTLKTALGGTVLETDRESVALQPDDQVRVDVLEFRRLVRQGTRDALAHAAQLYQGDFLAGFTLRDSPGFDEWQFFETESLRKQFAAVLEKLVTEHGETHEFKRAIEYARRWLALDPLHEPAHRALMQLYARDGQRAAALRQYRECVRQLEQELGVAPLPETTELYHAIEENRLTEDERPFVPQGRLLTGDERPFVPQSRLPTNNQLTGGLTDYPTTRLSDYPLVGRAPELAQLVGAYEDIHDDGRLLVVEGEAGIGKTRLAQEFLEVVRARGAHIISARGYAEQRALAYAPFVLALRAALEEPDAQPGLANLDAITLSDAARLLPELAPTFALPGEMPGLSRAETFGSQARFLDAITQLVLALTHATAPGVLFLDDVQWLDDASLDLLAFLIRRLRSAPLCLLLTWRSEEIAPAHPLRQWLAETQREGRSLSLALTRLGREDVQTLIEVAAARGAPVNAALAERLVRESEGQPFFLIESLRLLEREHQLPGENVLPTTVRGLLRARLARASETARQVLGAAAVIGRSFEFEIVQNASGRGEEEAIAALEELDELGLTVPVTSADAPQYDFTHDQLRALVYQDLSLARRRLLHRRVAEALAQREQPSGQNSALIAGQLAGQLAQHYRAGGEETLAAEYYKRAGDYARAVFANHDAVEHYSTALGLGFPDAATLHQAIGDAQTRLGEYDAALASYETADAFGGAAMDEKIAGVYLRRGEWERAAHYLANAVRATKAPTRQARLYADLALACHQLQSDASATKHATHALRLASRAHDEPALVLAHNILGILARTNDDLAAAQTHLEASAALAEKLDDAGAHAAALNNLALVYRAMGDTTRALELTQHALALVSREGDRHRQAALHNHLADLYHALGSADESMQHLKAAVAIYAEIGGPAGAWEPEIWKLEEW